MSQHLGTCRFERCDFFNPATGKIEPLPPYQPCAFCMGAEERCPQCKRIERQEAAIERADEQRKYGMNG